MIKLSVRAIAQYLASDDAARLQLLRERKYVSADSIGRARFYSEARRSITAFHRGALSRDMIEARIVTMRQEAKYRLPQARVELLHNADVLERYLYYQGGRALELSPPPTADLVRGDVEIAVRPSLFATEDGEPRLIFLELREQSNRAMMRVLAELAFEAFRSVLWNLAPRAVQVIDVRRGVVTELQHAGTWIGRAVTEACRDITAVWPQLTPLRGAAPDTRPTERQMAIAWDVES